MQIISPRIAMVLLLITASTSSWAALTVDRSRVIYNEGEKAVSLDITNRNQQEPYLAQGWMEDVNGKKLSEPLIVLPPVQRVEADGKSLVRIQALSGVSKLPKDRESVFYFNLREIPPKSDKPNTLMLAMQTRLKVFYRPAAIKVDRMAEVLPGTDTLTLTRQGERYTVHNPTPYYFTFVEVRPTLNGRGMDNLEPLMVAPKASSELPLDAKSVGTAPVLMFVNDYGSQRMLPFHCTANTCKAGKAQAVPEKPAALDASSTPSPHSNKEQQ